MKHKPPSIAKTTRPNLAGVYARNRLFRLLDRARRRPILWISGPAGSGKTTLVASYLDARKLPSLWYQVDEDDGDAATFFYYMGLAARQAAPGYRRPLPLLKPEYRAGLPAFTRRYFQELYRRLKPPFAVVFDDYHEVLPDSSLHEVARYAFGEIPEGANVIVISRGDPPSSLARLRANHAIEILGWEALRLTHEETEGIVPLQGAGKLSRAAVRRLHEKTEGWIAGLVLMLESTRVEDAAPTSASEFFPQVVFDYFAEEIFQKQEEKMRSFLLETVFLNGTTAGLAADLTGLREADSMLSSLNRNNYFTERRLRSEPVYQYHPLFREFLLARAKATFSRTRLVQVQQRAAALLASTGRVEDAATLLREAGDWRGFARLIVRQAPSLMAQGRISTVQEWLEALPHELIEPDACLQYWLGACLLPFDPARSRLHFVKAFGLFAAQGEHSAALRAWSDIVETVMYEWGDFTLLDEWIDRLEGLLRDRPGGSAADIECRVASSMFFALMFRRPDHPRLAFWRERALSLSRSDPDLNHRVMTGYHAAVYDLWMGHHADAAIVIDLLREAVRSAGASPLARLTMCEVEAIHGWHRVSRDACLGAVEEGFEIARATGISLWNHHLASQAVYATLSTGDLSSAHAWLQKMASAPAKMRHLDVSHYRYLSAWLALSRGELAQALQYLETSLDLTVQVGTPFPEALNRLALAQVLYEHGRVRDARKHLARALHMGQAMDSPLLGYMSFLTEAQFLLDRSESRRFLASLRNAMALGREQGFVNTPWWRPSVMARLCVKALESGIEVQYVRELVRKRGLVPETPPLHVESWPWPLKIYALGPFRLEHDDKPVQFSRKVQQKPLTMLKALVAFGGQEVPEERLLDALWPEAVGDVAHQAFATTLHRLRQLLRNEKVVLLKGGQLTLNPYYCWIDTWAFERLLEQAGDPESQGERWILTKQALNLYRGSFLSGDSAVSWAGPARDRLSRKFVRETARFGRHLEQNGNWRKAVECYETGLEADDLAEELYQRLIDCYARQGRRAEALAAYQRCRRTLEHTLGISPSPETEALYRSLAHIIREPSASTPAVSKTLSRTKR